MRKGYLSGMNGEENGGWWRGKAMDFTAKQPRPHVIVQPTSTPTAECLTCDLPSNLGRLLYALHFAHYGLLSILVQY